MCGQIQREGGGERGREDETRTEKEWKLNKNALTLPLVREIPKLRERKWHATKRNSVKKKRKKHTQTQRDEKRPASNVHTHPYLDKKNMHSHTTYQYKNIENIFSLFSLRLCVCHLRLFVCLCYPQFVLWFPQPWSKFCILPFVSALLYAAVLYISIYTYTYMCVRVCLEGEEEFNIDSPADLLFISARCLSHICSFTFIARALCTVKIATDKCIVWYFPLA